MMSSENSQKSKDPYQVQIGDVGTYTRGGQYGRQYWTGFTVIRVLTPGKTIEVQFDEPILIGKEESSQKLALNGIGWIHYIPEENKIRTLEYRRPGRWMFKEVLAKDMYGSISMGERRTEIEQGIF